ncbi:calmodulin [Sclerotinia borealis F-4128]|uniref:Calmodulin n=1 Tax=Sclerotinia borealis (strain F-4128) TaxID=1432307 RepID=W9CNJ3_SCLBF|nr:calmodulin [Sclerotinia borealis F-4128]
MPAPSGKPRSKLAKEHKLTIDEEIEIKEAFSLFSQKIDGEKEAVIATGDVRRALIALSLPPTPAELREFHSILDPEKEGYTVYRHFLAVCAIKFHSRTRTSDSHKQDVDDAFRLFTDAGQRGKKNGGEEGDDMEKITLASLKRVAKMLKEDVDEDLLVSMLLEANGEEGAAKGVTRDDFEDVMRRAGMWR